MPEGLGPRQVAMYAAVAVALAVLGARYLEDSGGGAGAAAAAGSGAAGVRVERARPASALVHVAGAVRRPGVYRLRPGARIDDAVRKAGGATAKADLGAVNLAAKVEDGRQVLVPERAPVAAAAAARAASSAAAPPQPLNLNTATLEQLDTLDGVGPVTAEKILRYREEHGGFGNVDELGQIPGIGEKRLASLREQVRV